MKKINLFFLLILTVIPLLWLSAQSISVEELRSNPYYEVKIDKDSVAEIYNRKTNLRWLKSTKEYNEPENIQEANLIIELDTLNLIYWENLYRQWGSIDAANPLNDSKYILADANRNGKNEIYAFNDGYSTIVYENVIDSLFVNIDTIEVLSFPIYDINDITNDGLFDIIIRSDDNKLRFFRQDSSYGFIDRQDFIYNPFPSVCQPNDVTFYDLDNDGVQEIIYYLASGPVDSAWTQCNHVARYNPTINNYELIYYHRPTPNWFTFGFATGDFDNDGKNNFSTGSIDGNYFIYEYVSGNNIQLEYQVQLETVNAFLSVMSEDMNGNGKNEIWVGSDFSSSLYGGVTRVFVIEPTGNGTYQIVYQIDIRGLFSGIYGRIRFVDVDGDGTKEIFLNNGTLVFCFKYNPQRNYYLDFIIDTWDYSQYDYDGTDATDLDTDGIAEFITQKHLNPGYIFKSIFWKRDKTVGVEDDDYSVPEEINLMQNYPNPFNPSTTIRFTIPQEAKVNIKVYNILGKEITRLLNETRLSGEYEISWNGTDVNGNLVPSGIYFITMIAGKYSKTIKALLLK